MTPARRPAPRAKIAAGAICLLCLLGAGVGCATPSTRPEAGRCGVTETANVAATMRDGTVLRADIYRPTSPVAVPVVLMRTQYGKQDADTSDTRYAPPSWFASHCYLVVIQDIRGQGTSGGVFSEFTHDQADGYDSVQWAAHLPGSNGKVGMYGSSYVGATQWLAAETAPPNLTTIVPTNTSADYYDGWTYEDGALRLGFIEPWAMASIAVTAARNRGDQAEATELVQDHLDIATWLRYTPYRGFPPFKPADPAVAPWFYDWISHRTDGPYWQQWAPNRYYPKITVPVLDIEGWYDAFLAGGVQNFTGMVASGATPFARNDQRLVIGPWDHVGWGRPTSPEAPMLKQIGPVGNSPINELTLAWFDHFLKGVNNGVITGAPRVDYFEMGANVWKHASAWPLPGTRWTPYYLRSDGHAGSLMGDGQLSTTPPAAGQDPDHYDYYPITPVPSVGGHSCCGAATGSQGPYDQEAVEQRPDVLVYTSPPLATDTEVTGPITVTLYASSSAPDTDWTAKLVDVHPDNTAVNLNNGIQRASFRDPTTNPTPITPGQIYQYTITVWPTSNLYRAGHRIRLEISSSDFPQFDPNSNTGSWAGQETNTQIAHQTVLHDPQHPSHLLLPIIPVSASSPPTTTFPITQ
jgi:hypothetical protein